MTEDQKHCIEMLEQWVCGRHHLPRVHEFGTGVCVNFTGDLATYDFDRLTRLVLLAHARAVRVEIASSGPRMVKVIAHRRRHGDRKTLRMHQYHPGIPELIAEAEKYLEGGAE